MASMALVKFEPSLRESFTAHRGQINVILWILNEDLLSVLDICSKQGVWVIIPLFSEILTWLKFSGVARAFPGGWLAHLEGQNEEENTKSLRKNKKNWSKFEEKLRKVEVLPTWDFEADYGPAKIMEKV